MEQLLKQFADSVIASKRNVFLFARLKLAGIYVLMLAVVLSVFSFILFQSLAINLLDTNDEDFIDHRKYARFTEHAVEALRNEIIAVDIIILLVSSGAAYVLAGYTLGPIKSALEAQRKFSENVSHELRTPLAVMKSEIEVLLREKEIQKPNVQRVLFSTIEEIDQLTRLTGDLLAVARSEYKVVDLRSINVVDIVRSTVEKMRPIALRSEVSIRLNAPDTLLALCSRGDVERIFVNLIQNSITHTCRGGSIIIDHESLNSLHRITLRDNGNGINAHDLPHVFERFYKGKDTQGAGLGLSIVKELCERNGMSIRIESTKGEGTLVSISLSAR